MKVLITGGTKGIGGAISKKLCEKGYTVCAVYNTDDTAAAKIWDELQSYHFQTFKADVANPADVQKLKAFTGDTDIIINNAGIADPKPFDQVTLEDWQRLINANLTSTFLVTQAFLPNLIHHRKGCIINISSIAAFTGGLVGAHYAASKAGQIGFTHYLASHLAQHNVRANAIAPALIETDMTKDLKIDLGKIPLNRLGHADEVVSAVLFLIENEFVTGQTIHVNGGMYFT